jgi:methyl-accepting chemotaxis protein
MSDPELRMLSDIAVKVGKLEAGQEATAKSIGEMASSVNRLVEKLDQSDDIAKEAGQRARSAHHRLDDVKAELEKKIDAVKSDEDKKITEIKDDIKWLWRTILAAVIASGIGGAVALIWKGIGH